jgi:hypothetical protein
VTHVTGGKDFDALPATSEDHNCCQYGLEIYVNNFMSIVIPTSKDQLEHVATVVMMGIHDLFPAKIIDGNDQILEKKLLRGEGQYSLVNILLGFEFDGNCHTMWLEEEKQENS